MTLSGRLELTNRLRLLYALADSRAAKSKILDQLVATAGYGRKYAIWLVNQPPLSPAPTRRRERRRVYTSTLLAALILIWDTCECICSKRLRDFIPEMIDRLEACGHLYLGPTDRALLAQMSASTIDRLLRPERAARRQHGRSTTKGVSGLKASIPVHTHADRHYQTPGHVEMDTVAHCGESTRGDYLVTLDVVDLATFWVEPITPSGRGQGAVLEALKTIRQRLPFPLLSIDSDNDGCFINDMMRRYCEQEHLGFGRSRPYRKNDQAHVEQRNWSVVRQLIGYDRFERDALVAFNAFWEKRRLYVNYFQPVRKLLRKQRIDGKVHKEYDAARTPYFRVMDAPSVSADRKNEIKAVYLSLDPVTLKQECDRLLRRVWERRTVRFLTDASASPGYEN